MSNWTAGYVSDIAYTFGYYSELNPLRARLALLGQGLTPPKIGRACELGFGQGLSANLHAASTSVDWHGTDFNPGQAAFAREMARHAGLQAQWRDDSFAEFCSRPDLPDFDFIGLHGIWSWISEENRHVLVDFIRRKLSVGGLLYISYNTMPGWAAFAPMRHLMVEHAQVMGATGGGIVSRIDGAIDFAERLLATHPVFSQANPQIGERIAKLKEGNRQYLAHEYFNKDWHPMPFGAVAQWLEPAKVQFACSAHFLDSIDAVHLSAEQQAFLTNIPDPMFRQSVRDFMVNQQFRRDYWIKGPNKLSPLDQSEALRQERFILMSHRSDVSMKIQGTRGEATLHEGVYAPILNIMADHRVHSIDEIESELVRGGTGIAMGQIVQAITVLTGMGHVCAVQSDIEIEHAMPTTRRLNQWLAARARGSGDINYLASPLTGGGVVLPRIQQLFLTAAQKGHQEVAAMALEAWGILASQGQQLIKEGQPIASEQESLQELSQQAKVFLDKQLPILKALQIA